MNQKNIVIALYSHPEYYPPTLNALEYLSNDFNKIEFVHRNISGFDWKYPANVKLYSSGKVVHVRQAEKQSILLKIFYLLSFTFLFWKKVVTAKPSIILIYDSMPLFSLRLFRKFISPKIKLWYHNHDVIDIGSVKKYSQNWFAWKSEQKIFNKLDYFSLPSVERKEYFPMNRFHGTFFFLPNYPSSFVYHKFKSRNNSESRFIKLLYQGSIGSEHGLEEIIEILSCEISGREMQLILKGFISDEYKKHLMELATVHKCYHKLIFIPPTGYEEVIRNAQSCHIGIGIHKKQDIMNKTLGTASNKIYEYAASGMPVLLYDNSHFRKSLGLRKWVFYTDTSKNSLIKTIKAIVDGYQTFSEFALTDFQSELSFEKYFLPALSQICPSLK